MQAYRARQTALGGTALYTSIDATTAAALDLIMMTCICSKKSAVELAIQRYAADLKLKGK